jgi:hypothetical protein
VLERLAKDDPAKLAQIAYGLLPRDIFVRVEDQRAPGGLDADSYVALRRLLDLIESMKIEGEPQAVFERIEAALRADAATVIELGGQRRKIIGKDAKGNNLYGDLVVGTAKACRAAREKRQERADAKAADLAPIIKELQAGGATSLRAIAAGLNKAGIPTARGGEWSSPQVMRILERLDPFRSEEQAAA